MIAYELLLEKIAAYQSDQIDEHLKQRLANDIVKANEGLCIYKAKEFVDSGVEWPELVNAARDGIYEAIKKFDLNKGTRFSTYACFKIKKHLNLVIDNNRRIRLPDSALRTARKAQRLIDQGITDIETIAATLGKKPAYIRDCVGMFPDAQQIPVDENGVEVKFEAPVVDDLEGSPIRSALAKLPPMVAEICIKRNCGWKFYEIAKVFQCSARHAQDLYHQALETLRELLTPEPSVEEQSLTNPYEAEIPTQRLDRMPVFYVVGRLSDLIGSTVARLTGDKDDDNDTKSEGVMRELSPTFEEPAGESPSPLCLESTQPSFRVFPFVLGLVSSLYRAIAKPFVKAISHTYQRMGRVRGPTS